VQEQYAALYAVWTGHTEHWVTGQGCWDMPVQ